MGIFTSSSTKRELREAKAQLRALEKRKREKMATSSNVDPSKAITELQPFQVNQERGAMPLSQLQHKDIWGNPIKEPDLTNPTRSRWERPLDTIKSFQAAIDRGYRRSYHGEPDASSGGPDSRWQSPRNSQRYDGGDQYNYPHYSRAGNPNPPPPNSSGEDHSFGVGAMSGRNALNESFTNNRAKHYSDGSSEYPDTGYGSSYHGSRGNSSGNLENDYMVNQSAHMGASSQPSPLASQMTPSGQYAPPPPPQPLKTQAPPQRNVIRLTNDPPPPSSMGSPAKEKRQNWLSKRLSRN